MTRYTDATIRGFLVAALVVPLLLTGCIKDLFGGEKPTIGTEIVSSQGTNDEQKLPNFPPKQPVSGQPTHKQQMAVAVGGPSRPDETLLPTGLPGNAGVAAETRPSAPVESTRQFAAGMPPDAAYGDAVLTEDCTWRGEVHVAGVVTVAPQATLTIEPGAVIRFGEAGESAGSVSMLLVYGRIDARGTQEKTVRFTSRFAQPMAGDWRGIVLLGSEKKNLFSSCRIEGAETGLDASFAVVTLKDVLFSRCTTGTRLRDCVAQVSGGGASGCTAGVRMTDSEADLRGAAITGNRQGVVAERCSLYLAGGRFIHNDLESLKAANCRVKISGGAFLANGAGIDLESSTGTVSGARIAENADYGIRLAGSRVKVYGNEISRNSGSGMKVADGQGAAWGNALFANGTYDLVNEGNEDFIALGNWWGAADPAAAGKRIFTSRPGIGQGRVLYLPPLKANPMALH
jgi:parallel beta-helix repeat protein